VQERSLSHPRKVLLLTKLACIDSCSCYDCEHAASPTAPHTLNTTLHTHMSSSDKGLINVLHDGSIRRSQLAIASRTPIGPFTPTSCKERLDLVNGPSFSHPLFDERAIMQDMLLLARTSDGAPRPTWTPATERTAPRHRAPQPRVRLRIWVDPEAECF
jgi:hypothetical protein